MRFYAERPMRLAGQVLADVMVLVWVVLCGLLASESRAVVLHLRAPGQGVAQAGSQMREAFEDAMATLNRIPVLGSDLARALDSGLEAGDSLSASGQDNVATIETMADGSAAVVGLGGAVPVLLVWLLVRLRYARAAGSAILIRRDNFDLLALRALTQLPVRHLLTTSADPAVAWRHGDRETIQRLAELQLRSLGLWGSSTPEPQPARRRRGWPSVPPD